MTCGDRRMQELIEEECGALAAMLVEKNKCYGNSVAEPCNVFATSDAMEQINVRIDDKLNRIKKGEEYGNEDTEMDLIGYLILKRVVRRWLNEPKETHGDCQCVGGVSRDDLDRAADLFLAHTGGSSRSAQLGEGIHSDWDPELGTMVKEGCRCRPPSRTQVLREGAKQRHGSVCGGGHD